MADTGITIDKKQLDTILKRLHTMSNATEPKNNTPIIKALQKSALRLETNIKKSSKMPVVTGRLRSSFHSKFRPSEVFLYTNKNGEQFNGSLKEVIKENEEVVVGSNVEYAAHQNYVKGFMSDAFHTTLPEIKQFLKDAFKVSMKGGSL